ncbi:MAG: LamG domain-containing protein, partial [Fibrobacteres bacterium]|nr:LamG domain-containing protein [Fibrobacterota bacterium]
MNKIFVIHFLFLVSLSAVEIFASSWSDDFNNAEKISSTSFAVLNGNGQIELDRRYPPVNFSYSPQDSVVLTIDSANHVSEYSAAFPKEQGTLEFWVNGPFSKTEPFGNLFDFWDNKRDHITIRTYGQYNKTCQLFCMDSSTGLYVCALNFDVPDSRWVHMALVWKWPLITIYVNGQSVGSVAISKTAWRPTAQKLLFGSGFPGVIKSVRLLSKVLSSAQIKDDYAAYYAVTGEVKSVAVRPVANLQWDKAEWSAITPASTSLRVFIESESADVWKPVSEVMLPGNTTGFASSPVNLANLTGHAFPVLRMSASLSTADSTKTPLLNSWAISWNSGLAHPRIYLTAAKRAFLQDKINRKVSPYIEFFNEIKNSAAYNAKRVPFKRDDYYILEDAQARTAGNVLPDMAMAYMFTDSIVYWNGLNRWIDSILIYPSWGGNRDLGAGHILYNLAIVYDWLYDSLTPARRVLIQNKLAVHADTLHQAWKNNKS